MQAKGGSGCGVGKWVYTCVNTFLRLTAVVWRFCWEYPCIVGVEVVVVVVVYGSSAGGGSVEVTRAELCVLL